MPKAVARAAPLSGAPMSLPEVLDLVGDDLAEIEARLAAIQRPDVPLTAEILDHVLAMRGKRVRPLLLLLVSRLGRPDRDAVLWASAVIEMVHTATLLHDDCLDDTRIRRGFPTVNHRWGQQAAILMGDYLFTAGFELLCEHRLHHALHILVHHTYRMTRGMNREYAGRRDPSLPVAEYLRIVDEKTGALFVSSCEIGALLAGLSEDAIARLSTFGHELGRAFQIIDDIFDYAGDPESIGKPVGTDFRLGFATLPLLCAWESGDAARGRAVAEIFARGDVDDAEWEQAREFVLESGGAAQAREMALRFAYAARDRLAFLNGHEGVAPLLATVEYMIARGR
jgi:geranylgeranyl pyrophosphate synthase